MTQFRTFANGAAIALIALTAVGAAQAAPVEYEFTSFITEAHTQGVAAGDAFHLDMFLDNGGHSASSQSWTGAQVVDFSLSAGSYWATYSTVFDPTNFAFKTDAAGKVSLVQFQGTASTSHNSDTFSSNFYGDYLYDNPVFVDSRGNYDRVAGGFTSASAWTLVNTVSAVPEPANVVLMLAGIGAIAIARRRRA